MVNSRLEKNKKQRKDIAKEEHIETTKNISKKIFKLFFIFILFFGSIYILCRYLGTSGLIVREYSLKYDNLPDNFYGLKIIQISDINYNKDTINIKKIKKLVKKINSIRPDIIVFTGNLIYGETTQEEKNNLETELTKLDAS